MPIRLTCDCGRTLNVKDELEGKRIKCPDCQDFLLVANGEADSGIARAGKKKSAGAGGSQKGGGGGKAILAILGIGVLLTGCCCLGGSGAGGWWFFFRNGSTDSALESKIVGKWTANAEPPKNDAVKLEDMFKLAFGGNIEFKADKTVIDNTPMTPITQGKWKSVSSQGDVITLELSQGPITKRLDVKVVSNDAIKITPADSKMEFAFKRAP